MVGDTALIQDSSIDRISNKHAIPDITYFSYNIKVLHILQNLFALLRMVHTCTFMHNSP